MPKRCCTDLIKATFHKLLLFIRDYINNILITFLHPFFIRIDSNHNSQHLNTAMLLLFMICVKELVENFGDLGHGAQSIYGYQSLTLYCDMKSANLDLRNRAVQCVSQMNGVWLHFQEVQNSLGHIIILSCGSITITTAYLRCSFSHLFNQPPLVQMDTIIISDEVTIFSISANYTNQAVR